MLCVPIKNKVNTKHQGVNIFIELYLRRCRQYKECLKEARKFYERVYPLQKE